MTVDPDVLAYRGGPNLVEALSVAKQLPAEALALAEQRPARIAAAVLAVAERAASGETLGEREQNLLFWGLHVLAAARDTRLFQPLLRLLRRPSEQWEELLGDAVTATLARVLTSVFDGDFASMKAALLDPATDEYVRWDLFGALSFLTLDEQIGREATRAFLVRFDDERLVRAGDHGWVGWAETIALLGFVDLADRIEAARRDARLLEDLDDPTWFEDMFRQAEQRPTSGARFAEQRLGFFGGVVEEMETSLGGVDESEADGEALEPAHNRYRDVGRNDPCPCGSGKKFKKCCLAA